MSPRIESSFAGLVLAVAATGLALALATVPWVTGVLVDRVDSASLAGLSGPQTRILAEEVRAYVTSSGGSELRSSAFGRPAFDAKQVEHLDDVRAVMSGARFATIVAALLAGTWIAWRGSLGRWRLVRTSMRVAGGALLGSVTLVLVAGLADFEALFTRFHGVFFKPGTWQFASDDLVIQLFPEPFWIAAGGIWAALLVAIGVLLVAASWAVGRQGHQEFQEG